MSFLMWLIMPIHYPIWVKIVGTIVLVSGSGMLVIFDWYKSLIQKIPTHSELAEGILSHEKNDNRISNGYSGPDSI